MSPGTWSMKSTSNRGCFIRILTTLSRSDSLSRAQAIEAIILCPASDQASAWDDTTRTMVQAAKMRRMAGLLRDWESGRSLRLGRKEPQGDQASEIDNSS